MELKTLWLVIYVCIIWNSLTHKLMHMKCEIIFVSKSFYQFNVNS